MTIRNPIVANTFNAMVLLLVDSDTAVAIADSIDFGVASGGVSTTGRPLGVDDVDVLRAAAAQAAAEADPDVPLILGAGATVAEVPTGRERPPMVILHGGDRS